MNINWTRLIDYITRFIVGFVALSLTMAAIMFLLQHPPAFVILVLASASYSLGQYILGE